jgi:hypothetical protein
VNPAVSARRVGGWGGEGVRAGCGVREFGGGERVSGWEG